jgi:uncharacterized membrane protein YeaQ/YmgE (transglycosylase-associated protein family)
MMAMWWLAQVQTPPVTIPSFTVPTIVVALLIAVLIGVVVQLVVGYTHIGFFGHILVGILGAFLGSLIAFWLKLPTILVVAGIDVGWTFLGSAILAIILAFLVGGSRYRGYFRRRYY